MRLFGLFKPKDPGTGMSDIKHMYELLDLPGLLGSLPKVDRKYLPNALEYILDIITNEPHILRLHGSSLPGPIMLAPIRGDPISEDKWFDLALKLVELGYLESMLQQGLPMIVSEALTAVPDPDWRLAYLAMEVSRSQWVGSVSGDEHLLKMLRTLETGDPRAKQYAVATLNAIMNRNGPDQFIRLGIQERLRSGLLEPDQYITDLVRSMLARCEQKATAHDRLGSMVVEDSTVLIAGEAKTETVGRKEEEGKESDGGYYRPGSRAATRSRSPPSRNADDPLIVEDLNLRRRRVDARFEKETEAAIAEEARTVYCGTGDDGGKTNADDDDDFVIEE